MKKTIIICVLFFATGMFLKAQTQENMGAKFDISKLELGGTFGFSFGKSNYNGNYTSLNLSPQVGYKFNPKFSAGFGPSYIYRGYSDIDYSENYGGLTFYARIKPINYLMLFVGPEFYRTWGKGFESKFVPTLLLGAGTVIPLGNKGGISITLSYDVIQNDRSPYWNQLVYSIGYVFGF